MEVENAYGFAADTSLALNTVKIVWLPGCESPVIGEAHHVFLQFLNLLFFSQFFFVFLEGRSFLLQSYEIKSPPWTILWFRILGIFSVENIKRLCVFMFQT